MKLLKMFCKLYVLAGYSLKIGGIMVVTLAKVIPEFRYDQMNISHINVTLRIHGKHSLWHAHMVTHTWPTLAINIYFTLVLLVIFQWLGRYFSLIKHRYIRGGPLHNWGGTPGFAKKIFRLWVWREKKSGSWILKKNNLAPQFTTKFA